MVAISNVDRREVECLGEEAGWYAFFPTFDSLVDIKI